MKLIDAQTMRALDQHAIQETGIPGLLLMENAGRGATQCMLDLWGEDLARGVLVLCGRGNNGGDGFVIARHLHNAGVPVAICLFGSEEALRGDALTNFDIVRRMGLLITSVVDASEWALQAEAFLEKNAYVVDALLGTGLQREVSGLLARVIEDVNRATGSVFAVDIPSGLNASTGRPQGPTIRAAATATFGVAKLGLVMDTAIPYVGKLSVVDISIPREQLAQTPTDHRQLDAAQIIEMLPARDACGHKGTFGHLAVVAGSAGKMGAAVLCAHGALRSGTGLVTLVIPSSCAGELRGLWPEVMLEVVEDQGRGCFGESGLEALLALLAGKRALAIGPGLGGDPAVAGVVRVLVARSGLPMVVDADGLNGLSAGNGLATPSLDKCILTPHPGEAGRLLSCTATEIQGRRLESVIQLAIDSGAVALLKGCRTLVASPLGRISVNPTGNSGMASAGVGDVLTGVIGGLLAQGLDLESAACVGAYLHGLAGDLAQERVGQRAMVAGDVIAALGPAFSTLLQDDG